jgi:two-component sensor histidine kinase
VPSAGRGENETMVAAHHPEIAGATYLRFDRFQNSEMFAGALISDLSLALAYFSILITITYFYLNRRRSDLGTAGDRIAWTGIAFAAPSAIDNGLEALIPNTSWNVWEVTAKMLAACLALTAAVLIWPIILRVIRQPSRAELRAEIAQHVQSLQELRAARDKLAVEITRQNQELERATQRFETALRQSSISMFNQDRDMKFLWVKSASQDFLPDKALGNTDQEILPKEAAERAISLKRKVIETGSSGRMEIVVETKGASHCYDLAVEPLRASDGSIVGTSSVAVDITRRKLDEERLRLLLREITHRSKNLLAVIQAIARQTASRAVSKQDFLAHFEARVTALARAHDLLIRENWHGCPVRELIESQLSNLVARVGHQIFLDGPELSLRPEVTQNVALALHELASNAVKYGALSVAAGKVFVGWAIEESGQFRLTWREQGGPAVSPPAKPSFGITILESAIARGLDGEASIAFRSEGVAWELAIPSDHVVQQLPTSASIV